MSKAHVSVFRGIVVWGREAHTLNIHTNKYVIINCIRCSEGKECNWVIGGSGPVSGVRTAELWSEGTGQAQAEG